MQESNQKRLHDLAMMQSRADTQESEVRTFIKEIRRYAIGSSRYGQPEKTALPVIRHTAACVMYKM